MLQILFRGRTAQLALSLAIVFAFTSSLFAGREDEITRAVAKVKDSVVAVYTLNLNKDGLVGIGFGAGAVIDSSGFVLTCQHVVEGSQLVIVELADGTAIAGDVVSEDKNSDLAVIQISSSQHKLQEVKVTSSSDLILGERIFTIGTPHGMKFNVTFGRISSLSINLRQTDGTNFARQDRALADADANPGNSGGPCFNSNGEFIGVVNAIVKDTQGISVLIKSDVVEEFLAGIASISRHSLTHGITARVKLQSREGANRQRLVVDAVTGPAQKAGLKPGDVILKVAGMKVRNRFDLERSLRTFKEDDEIPVSIARGTSKLDLKLTLAKLPAPPQAATTDSENKPEGQPEGSPPQVKPDDQPQVQPGDQPETPPGSQPQAGPDGQPQVQPDGQPQAQLDGQSTPVPQVEPAPSDGGA